MKLFLRKNIPLDSRRTRRRFALFPVKIETKEYSMWVWLEHYFTVERYSRALGWVRILRSDSIPNLCTELERRFMDELGHYLPLELRSIVDSFQSEYIRLTYDGGKVTVAPNYPVVPATVGTDAV